MYVNNTEKKKNNAEIGFSANVDLFDPFVTPN